MYTFVQALSQIFADGPTYQVEFTVGTDFMYEVRNYPQTSVAAETQNDSDAFSTLADYIGVGGEPQNEGSVDISMTAPVTIKMTAPVIEGDGYMQFILPSEYDTLDSAPTPLNEDVTLVEIEPHSAAVYSFKGYATDSMSTEMTQSLLSVVNATLQNTDYPLMLEENTVELLQYNGPWTLNCMRRNEIKIKLSPEQEDELSEMFGNGKRMLRF